MIQFHSCVLCDKVIADIANLPIMVPRRFNRYAVAAANQLIIRHNCPGNQQAPAAPENEEKKTEQTAQEVSVIITNQ